MKSRQIIFISTFLLLLISSSCVTRKKLTYLQQFGRVDNSIIRVGGNEVPSTLSAYRVMPYDNLYIRVITPDPQWSALFNTDVGAAGITQESAALSGYSVDVDGFIEIPYVGKLSVGGKTLPEIKTQLDSVFKNYVSDAAITVRLVNNYVGLIGEVRAPGRYMLTKDRITIFDALSMAGDMNEFSNRQKLQVIRPSPNGPVIKEFSLGDRSILSSEYYYIMPNDIIYAIPRQGRSFQVNSSVWTVLLGTITSALATIAFFRTF